MNPRTRIIAALIPFLLAGPPARANAVFEWNALMMDAIRKDNSGPTLSTRNLAILHAAIYDAVNGILGTHQPYLVVGPAPAHATPSAAAAAAGRRVCVALYPSFQARADDLFRQQRAGMPATAGTTNGLAWGQQVAEALLSARSQDGANTQVPYIPNAAPGQWRRTPPYFRPPLDPHWRYVLLFALPDSETFVPPPPPALDSPEYAAALNEVKQIGEGISATRTPEQSSIAVFWSDFSYTAMPPGHWHEIAVSIARDAGLSLPDAARLMALISLAQADAGIVCWEAKYRYNLWRPVTAIQRAGEDDNAATESAPSWDHYLAAPPFPEYPSGHSTFSKTSAQVLTRFFGTDAVHFEATSDSLPGVVRRFESLSACADEVGLSRIYGGIHFPFANREGKRSGARIGDFVAANYLLANDALPLLRIETIASTGCRIRVHGVIGQAYVLEASPDLTNWQPVATNAAVAGGFVVAEPSGSMDHQFFRARERGP